MDESSNAEGRDTGGAGSWVTRPSAPAGWVTGEVRPGRAPSVLDALITAGHGEGPDVDE